MLTRTERSRLFLRLVVAEIGCLAVGLWLHHGMVVSAVHRAAEEQALAALAGSLLISVGIAWAWTSPLLIIIIYLIVTRLFDELSKKQEHAAAEALQRTQSLVRTRDAVIIGLASLAESRDETTGRHVERVSYYSSRLAVAASHDPKFREIVTPEFVRQIAVGSTLHDIGKVGIEDWLLFKPGRYTPTERQRMQRHSTLGGKYLADLDEFLGGSPVISMAREIALWHHERWDGKGYPDGLAGEEIPLSARITAIADVYDALTSLRDYKPPYPHERCVEMLRSEAGKQFDPDLVAIFLRIHQSFQRFAFQSGEPAFDSTDPKTPEPKTSEEQQSDGLVAAMRVLDQNWTVPTTSHYWR